MREKFICTHFATSERCKIGSKTHFFAFPLPVISHPKPPFFVRFSRFGGKVHLFRGVFLFSSREILARNLCFRRKNQFDGEFFRPKHPKFDFCGQGKRESRRFFSLPQTEQYQNKEGSAQKQAQGRKNTRPSRKRQRTKSKSKRTTRKRPSTSKQGKLFSSPSPTPREKYKPTFSQNFSTFRDFLPCFSQNLPTPHKLPFHPTRRTRAYAYVRARALSEFAIFAFTLHLTPQQTVYQSIECEGKLCIHLHLHRNNLKNNTLHDIRCKKTVKAKG